MRLAKWRREKGLTQEELAALLGCTQPYISSLERSADPAIPSTEFLRRLYRATQGDVTPNDIVFPDGMPDLDAPELQLGAGAAPLLDAIDEGGRADAKRGSAEAHLQDMAA